MAAPSTSGFTLILNDTFTFGVPSYPGVITAPLRTSVGSSSRVGWAASPSLTDGDIVGGRRTFTARNMTNELFWLRHPSLALPIRTTNFGGNFTTPSAFMLALFDSSGNYRRWKIFGPDTPRAAGVIATLVDPSQTRTMVDESATPLDLTSINAFEIHVQYNGTTVSYVVSTSSHGVVAKSGISLSGGEIGDPVNMTTLSTYATALQLNNTPESTILFAPVRIEADYAEFDSNYFIFQLLATDGADNVGLIHCDDNYGITIDAPAGSTININKSLIVGRNKCDFKVLSAGAGSTISLNALTISKARDVLFNSQLQALNFLISNFEAVTTAGAELLNFTVDDGLAGDNLIIDDITQLDGAVQGVTGDIVITLPAGNYNSTLRLDLPPNKLIKMAGGGGSYSFTGLTGGSGGNPVVFDATDGEGYVITIGASLIAEEADPVTSGTVDLIAPVADYARGVSGAPVGSAIAIFKRISSLVADRSQFTLASGNDSGDSALFIAETIPNDTPDSGFIRVLRDDGSEDRLAFSSWVGSTFTLSGTLPATYSAGNGCYVGYVDVLGSSTGNESVDLEYVSDRDCVLVVRLGSGSGRIREIRQDITLTDQDQVTPISGFIDTINTTT